MKLQLSKGWIIYGVLLSTVVFNNEVAEARISGKKKTAKDQHVVDDKESTTTTTTLRTRKTLKKTKKPKKAKKSKYDAYYGDDDDTSAPGLEGGTGDEEEPPAVEKKKKRSIGLALPGGGFAAGAAVGGIMRGFQRSTILIDGEERPAMEGFDYVASLSGGNFANVMYSYAPETTSDKILDADGIGHPSEITAEELDNIPETSMFSLFTESINVTLASAIANSAILRGEDFWDTFVHMKFLEPLGIRRFQAIGETRDDVKAVPLVMTSIAGPAELYPDYVINSDEGMNNEFVHLIAASAENKVPIPSEDLPFPFTEGTYIKTSNDALWELAKLSSFKIPYGAYISPDEFTIPMSEHRASFDDLTSMAADPIDFIPVAANPDDLDPKRGTIYGRPSFPFLERKFTLSKLLSAGTNLVTITLAQSPWLGKVLPMLTIPSTIKMPTADGSMREMALVDGGYNSATGIASLVHKGVKKIILHHWLVEGNLDPNAARPYFVDMNNIAKYFGIISKPSIPTPPGTKFTLQWWIKTFFVTGNANNHLFDLHSNGENQLMKLFAMFDKLYEAGEPLIATLKDLDVVENKFWGIEKGGKVDLTVIMNVGVPKKFSDDVPLDSMNIPDGMNATDSLGYFTDPELSDAPNLRHITAPAIKFFIPPLNVSLPLPIPEFATRSKSTRMTEIMNSWIIEHSWEGLKDKDGNVVFEGFKEIFEEEENE